MMYVDIFNRLYNFNKFNIFAWTPVWFNDCASLSPCLYWQIFMTFGFYFLYLAKYGYCAMREQTIKNKNWREYTSFIDMVRNRRQNGMHVLIIYEGGEMNGSRKPAMLSKISFWLAPNYRLDYFLKPVWQIKKVSCIFPRCRGAWEHCWGRARE